MSKQEKSAARLYALQALFQMEASDQTIDDVRDQFVSHRFGATIEGDEFAEGDIELFENILNVALRKQAKIDQLTNEALADNWPIDRIDPTLRALFRAGGAELSLGITPPKVVISEFVDLAKAFFSEGKEAKFVNAVLDKMAKTAGQI